ncbi:MAG: hypothetical protein ACQGQP_01260 [Desulfovibrio sp.]|nr:hypothetical protein [Mailhella sp.]
MPWILAALALCALFFLFPRRGGLLLSVLAGAALLIWGGIWAFDSWQDARIRRIEISLFLPEYPDGAMELPASWADSGRAGELRDLWQGSLPAREKRRRANSIVYGCALEDPILADIRNGNARALLRYGVAVEAYLPGRSTNLAGHHQAVLDVIIPAGGQKTVCLPAPRLQGGAALDSVVLKATVKEPLFD